MEQTGIKKRRREGGGSRSALKGPSGRPVHRDLESSGTEQLATARQHDELYIGGEPAGSGEASAKVSRVSGGGIRPRGNSPLAPEMEGTSERPPPLESSGGRGQHIHQWPNTDTWQGASPREPPPALEGKFTSGADGASSHHPDAAFRSYAGMECAENRSGGGLGEEDWARLGGRSGEGTRVGGEGREERETGRQTLVSLLQGETDAEEAAGHVPEASRNLAEMNLMEGVGDAGVGGGQNRNGWGEGGRVGRGEGGAGRANELRGWAQASEAAEWGGARRPPAGGAPDEDQRWSRNWSDAAAPSAGPPGVPLRLEQHREGGGGGEGRGREEDAPSMAGEGAGRGGGHGPAELGSMASWPGTRSTDRDSHGEEAARRGVGAALQLATGGTVPMGWLARQGGPGSRVQEPQGSGPEGDPGMGPAAGGEALPWGGAAAAIGPTPQQWSLQPQAQGYGPHGAAYGGFIEPGQGAGAQAAGPPPSKPTQPLPPGTFPSYPPPAAFLGPKCALWDCLRPGQGDYCSELHAAMAATEGGAGRAPVVRPWGIELKDPLLLAALRARIAGKAVGIPDCEKAATAKSPWGAPELFDVNMLVGEPLREWLFFDKSQPAYGTGTRKQRALPDYCGRWHDSYKQHFKDHGGLKRILYLDPQPPGNLEWHLYEYEIKGASEWALYRLEMKKKDPTKSVNSVLIQSSQKGGHKSAFTVVKPRPL